MGRFYYNPSFNEYVGLLEQLHVLMSTDRGETDEAEDVRDRMDAPWQQLNLEESRVLRGLSADLYSIGFDREMPVQGPDASEFQSYDDALRRKDWIAALDVIRRNESKMPPGDVAFIRGVCWAHLKQPRVALHFLQEAYRLGRQDVMQDVLSMTCQVEIGVTEPAGKDAASRARISEHPLVVLRAATVLLNIALRSDQESRPEQTEKSLEAFRRGLALARPTLADATERTMLSSEILNAHIQMAIAFDALDQLEAARESCLAALDIDPVNQHALALLGWVDQRNRNAQDLQNSDSFRREQHRLATVATGQVLASMSPAGSFG